MTTLRSCPFCGGRPRIEKPKYCDEFVIRHGCKGIDLRIHGSGWKTKQDAVRAWNQRAFERVNKP